MTSLTFRPLLGAAAVLVVLAAGCGDDADGDAGRSTMTTGTTTEAASSDEAPDPAEPVEEGGRATSPADGVLTDGVWAIGDAGTVEFTVGDGGLDLADAVAAGGWSVSIEKESAGEIEVDFRRDAFEYEVEIEYEDGVLEIEVDLDVDPADPGPVQIGPAATADVAVDGGSVRLDDLVVADGWEVVEEDADGDAVEFEVRSGEVTWEFKGEADDGRLEIEIDFRIAGPFAG